MKNSGKAIVSSFLGFQNQIKLFHWQTKSYAQHQAFGKAYEELTETIDEFLEVYIGKYSRPTGGADIQLDDYSGQFLVYINGFIKFLVEVLPTLLSPKDTDLLNLRDEMLGTANQLKYLLTLS
jgi:hypothetical protein